MKTESNFIGVDEVEQYADTPDSINNEEEDFEIYFIDDDDVEVDELMELLDRDMTDINSDDIDFLIDNMDDLPAACYDDEPGEIVAPIVGTDTLPTFDPTFTSTMTLIDVNDVEAMLRITRRDSSFDDKINSEPNGNSTNVDNNDMTSDLNSMQTGHFETIQGGNPILREQSQNLTTDPSLNNNS